MKYYLERIANSFIFDSDPKQKKRWMAFKKPGELTSEDSMKSQERLL